jgi:predicted dehydrogenase
VRIYDDPKYQVIISHANGKIERFETDPIQTNENQTKSGVIDAFIETIRGKKESPVSVYDGLQSIKIIDAIMKSAATGKKINIE